MSRVAKRIVAWRDVAKPHNDIIEGRFDPSVFAVNIYAVYRNRTPSDYQEPERFFAKTYLTRGLKELISSVLRRLDGQANAEAVLGS
jgi:predicted AAA+ superfamily ATPase